MKELKIQTNAKEQYSEFPFPNDKPQKIEDVNIHNWILKALPNPIPSGSSICDIGCGTGEMSLFLSNYGNVTGYDRNMASLEIANDNKHKFNRDIRYVNLDITQENDGYEKDKKYDYVFSIGMLPMMSDENIEIAIENIKKFAKDDGIIVLSVYNYYSWAGRNKFWRKLFPEPEETNINRKVDDDYAPYERLHTQKEFKQILKNHNLKIIGQFRNIPDWVRLITGKNCMMTFACKIIKEKQNE